MNIRGLSPAGPRAGAAAVEVYSITSATESLGDDQSRRARRYMVQMAIRMACFGGAIFFDGLVMWLLLAAAILLPYVAVIEANSGRPRRTVAASPMEYLQLTDAPSAPSVADPDRGDARGPRG